MRHPPLLFALAGLSILATWGHAEERADDEDAGEIIEVVDRAPIDTTPPGQDEVEREELRVIPGSRGDALSALKNLPGIAAAPAFDGGGDLAVRGTAGEDSLYLVDGVPIPLSMHFDNLQSVIPSEMIERIDFLPGGFGVEYGRATGGIVSIVTRHNAPQRWSGFAEMSFINASGLVRGPISKEHGVSFLAGFRRSIIDALLPAVLPDDSSLDFQTPPRYYDAQARIDWVPSHEHRLSLTFLGSDDRTGFSLAEENPHDPEVTGTLRGRDAFGRAFVRWQYDGGAVKNDATLSLGASVRERYLNDTHFYRVEPRIVYARNQLTWKAHRKMSVRAGGDVGVARGGVAAKVPLPITEGGVDSSFTADPHIDADIPVDDEHMAAWSAIDLQATKPLMISAGVRVDRYNRNPGTRLHPRVSATYQLAPALAVRAAAGTYSRAPALAESMRTDLEPEHARHLVGGVDVTPLQGVRVSLTGFHTKLSKLVALDTELMDDPLQSYRNQGKGRVIGAEAMVRLRRADLFGWLAYTVSRSTRVDGPGRAERLFDYDQTHNLTAVGSYRLGKWRLGGRFRLASGLPYTPVTGSVYLADHDIYRPMYGEHNSERMSVSHQIDLRVDRRFRVASIALDAYLDVSNVYANAQELGYEYNFDYSKREVFTDVPFLPSLGLRGTF